MQPEPAPFSGVIRFADFEVALRSHELRRGGHKVRLQERSFQVLNALLRTPGRVVTREELVGALWPKDTFVDAEHGLNAAVRRLREALGDSAEEPRFVETLPRIGYRFIGEIREAHASRDDRPVVLELLRPAVDGDPGITATQPTPSQAATRARRWWILGLVAGVAVIALGILAAWSSERASSGARPATLTVASAAGSATPPQGVADLLTRGRYLQNMKRFAEARHNFEEALRLDPENGAAMGGLSLALLHLGQRDEAIATARRALDLDPNAADAYATLAYWRKGAGDFEGAERYFRRAVEGDPANGKGHNRLARMLLELGKVEDAREHVLAARRLDPLNPDFFEVVMSYELATGDTVSAAREADSWTEIWSKQVANPRPTEYTIAEVYTLVGRYDEALALYGALYPGDELLVAWVRACQGRSGEALGIVDRFIAENPDPADQPNDLLARIYMALGDFDRTFFYLDRLVAGREQYPLWVRYKANASLQADSRWPELSLRLEREFLGGGAAELPHGEPPTPR